MLFCLSRTWPGSSSCCVCCVFFFQQAFSRQFSRAIDPHSTPRHMRREWYCFHNKSAAQQHRLTWRKKPSRYPSSQRECGVSFIFLHYRCFLPFSFRSIYSQRSLPFAVSFRIKRRAVTRKEVCCRTQSQHKEQPVRIHEWKAKPVDVDELRRARLASLPF